MNLAHLIPHYKVKKSQGYSFAAANIALIKYWGKENSVLNIPYTDSLSLSLANLGTTTIVELIESEHDNIWLNNKLLVKNNDDYFNFYNNIVKYLDLFRGPNNYHFKVKTVSNIPIAAGLASSAAGFAALILALNDLFQWRLSTTNLSILARLGSGSAARSIEPGFIYWQKGARPDGLDSYAYRLANTWPELCLGLLIFNKDIKTISSREAMDRTVHTSRLYQLAWQAQVKHDLKAIIQAINAKNFSDFGLIAENNAMAMHATMLAAKPAICYSSALTILAMHKIWQARNNGLEVYFTQDAGPNLKLLFLYSDYAKLQALFSDLQIIQPFTT